MDRVLTRNGPRPWVIEGGWGCLSDHRVIEVRAKMEESFRRMLHQMDWKQVREYVHREKELAEAAVGVQDNKEMLYASFSDTTGISGNGWIILGGREGLTSRWMRRLSGGL